MLVNKIANLLIKNNQIVRLSFNIIFKKVKILMIKIKIKIIDQQS